MSDVQRDIGRAVAPWLAALAIALMAGACGNQAGEPGGQNPVLGQAEVAAASAVMVRGRIGPDGVVLEPVLVTGARATPTPAGGAGHRLRGADEAGEILFDFRFRGTPVADLPSGAEEHFQHVVALEPGGNLRLARLDLDTEDGRQARRHAVLSAAELTEALAADDAIRAHALGDDRFRIRWDSALFPLVLIQDPETGHVLAMGRGGEAIIVTASPAVAVTVSEGVRSGVRQVRLP